MCRDHLAERFRVITKASGKAGINYRRDSNARLFPYIDISPYRSPSTPRDERGDFGLAQRLMNHKLL